MNSFILDVLNDLHRKEKDISELFFVLPNKRSGVILKNELAAFSKEFQFAPSILSVEEFVQEISDLQLVSPTRLLIETYKAYRSTTTSENPESFDQFLNWGPRLIQDFIEIDRYLIDVDDLFKGIMQLKSIEAFGKDPKTPMVRNYLKFWDQLLPIYDELRATLIRNGFGHQGLMYRQALEHLESYLNLNEVNKYVILGFNALNASEEIIFKELLSHEMAEVYWDNDQYFLDNEVEEAGLFMRGYFNSWPYYQNHPVLGIHNHYTSPKSIRSVETPKSVGQAKFVGGLIKTLWQKNKCHNTAIVLADETLLIPLLTALPDEVDVVNITMGFPLKSTPVAGLIASLFDLQTNGKDNQYYYKYIINVLSNPLIHGLFNTNHSHWINDVIVYIHEQNLTFVSVDQLKLKAPENSDWIDLIFGSWQTPSKALDHLILLIEQIKHKSSKNSRVDILILECLYKFYTLFNSLKIDIDTFEGMESIKTLEHLYTNLLEEATLDFKGEPVKGLQIMGILESRVLDFETVIVTTVNEGVLPAGKQQHSFIPYDVKRAFDLPTIKEKDAIYAYHFYHLMQRASEVYLIYDAVVDRLQGGECSRYLLQLEVGGIHTIQRTKAVAETPLQQEQSLSVSKSALALESLKELGSYGYSPSALTLYIKDPLLFYRRYLLGLKETNELEESMAARTFGNAIHNTLEALYKPLKGAQLSASTLAQMRSQAASLAEIFFKEEMKGADIKSGKNLLTFEVGKHYIFQLIDEDLRMIKEGNSIKIVCIEEKLEAYIPISSIPYKIKLRGKIDRVDEFNGRTRVIDYKTGSNITASSLKIKDWSALGSNYDKYHKCFQILCYAYIWKANNPKTISLEGGVYALKNMSLGFLKLGIPEEDSKSFHFDLDAVVLNRFEKTLIDLISSIHDSTVPFESIEVS